MPRRDQVVGDLALHRSVRIFSAAVTAASAAAARTSATACASACAILVSAILVRRATNSSILVLASAAIRSASALAPSMIAGGLVSAWRCLRLVFGEQLLRFFLQPARLVEFGLHALGALVERIDQHLRHADIDQDADEDRRRRRRPRIRALRTLQSSPQRLSASSTAAATAGAAGAVPISRSTMARRGVDRDAAHVRHGGRFRRGDLSFRPRQAAR